MKNMHVEYYLYTFAFNISGKQCVFFVHTVVFQKKARIIREMTLCQAPWN